VQNHRRITLSISNPEIEGDEGDLLSLDVYPDMTVDTLRSSIQAETRIEPSAQHLYHNGQLIADYSKTMSQLGIGDGDMLALHVRDMRGTTGVPAPAGAAPAAAGRPRPSAPRRDGRPQQDPELIRLQVLGNAHLRAELQRQQPEMAAALEDPQRFAQLFNASFDREQRERLERQQMIQRLNDVPFDVEAQARIEEMIRQERVMENLQNAMEHNPEGMDCYSDHLSLRARRLRHRRFVPDC
jgi:DNA damage-inducible protein 1